MTVGAVRGFGRQGGQSEVYRGAEYRIDLVPKLRLEVVVPADLVEDVVLAIREGAATGKLGDGKIWVDDVERVVRACTAEEGPDALM